MIGIADALENVHDAGQNREAKQTGAGGEADGLHARGGQRPRCRVFRATHATLTHITENVE
jgi:hypothetical protein